MPQIVFYHIQKDPGDDSLHPEAFMISKESNITVGDVLDEFPIKNFGNFHIRFRLPLHEGYLWLDAQDRNQPAPLYNGSIFLKVLNLDKLGKQSQRTPIIDSIPKEEISSETPSPVPDLHSPDTPVEDRRPRKSPRVDSSREAKSDTETYDSPIEEKSTPKDDDELFEFISTPPPPMDDIPLESPQTPASTASASDDVFTMHFGDTPKHEKKSVETHLDQEEDLMMHEGSTIRHVTPEVPVEKAEVSDKVKEMAARIVIDESASQMTGTTYEGKDENVIQAMKQREEKLREKQAQAVAEQIIREKEKEEMQEERAKIHSKIGAQLDEWANDAGGERKPIRTLLCTMGNVMWEGSNWKAVSMSDVLSPEKVKLYYRKAMLKVHPDKNSGASAEQVYRAQRIFEALNQAWSKFQDQQNNSF